MFALFLLALLGVWMLWDYGRDRLEHRREHQRRTHKATLRREHLARNPDSPAAYEMLGDAMREAGEIEEAVACYEEAREISARTAPGQEAGSGWIPGGGLENKLRLARFELAERSDPAEYGQTLATRPQICRTCGGLSGPQDHACAHCGTNLPVDGFWDTLRRRGLRQDILRETLDMLAKFAVVVVVVVTGSWMPLEIRGALLISAVIVLPFRLLKRIGPD
jgi:tetratricopeptide (TPR) repeat protein